MAVDAAGRLDRNVAEGRLAPPRRDLAVVERPDGVAAARGGGLDGVAARADRAERRRLRVRVPDVADHLAQPALRVHRARDFVEREFERERRLGI